ncbi:hypothetical protein A3SI_10824 [Nitritalea halalkaliphila LW7]|uniref:Outer membrane protein beta-barrel domain-containing protein n=1 Tax=Nitritalea halalkaliphila LW7 TaxID=1189621 RepID=I5C397_9BACT|nr:hypothetical protein A3SI_10824 [Nitritalea halalkaliphila LW7]
MLFYAKTASCLLLFLLLVTCVHAQRPIFYQLELGTERFYMRTFDVDPGPNWSGFPLEGSSSFALDLGLGIQTKKWASLGIGLGYAYFPENTLVRVALQSEIHPFQRTLSPFLRMRLGYSSLNTFEENSRQSPLAEGIFGLRYRLSPVVALELSSGVALTQQTLFIPIRIACRWMPHR